MSDSQPDPTPSPAAGSADAGAVDAATQEIAAVYAKALLSAAETAGKTAQIVAEAQQIVGWLAGEPKFVQVLASELLGDDEKQGIIDRLFAAALRSHACRFLADLISPGPVGNPRADPP